MNLNNQQHLKGAIIAVIIAAAVAILTIMIGEDVGESGGKLFLICFSFIFFGITSVICLVTGAKPGYAGLGNAGAIASGLAFLFVTIITLSEPENEVMFKLTGALTIASIALAHISLLHHFTMQNKYASQARVILRYLFRFFH